MKRPLDVTLSSIYYAGFSAVLIGILLWQIASGGIHERWTDAVFPVAFCFVLAMIPGVVALGLWTLDGAARIGSVVFAFLHLVVTFAFLSKLSGVHILPYARIVLDCLLIAAMFRPEVRKAFQVHSEGVRLTLR
jgi:hypothetical protein